MFVILRLVSRLLLSKGSAGLDDVLITLSLVVVYASNITVSLAVAAGLGKSLMDIPPTNWSSTVKMMVIANSLMVWTYAFPKLAIIALLRRLFTLHKYVILLFWILGFINIGLSFATSVLWFRRCSPIQKQWDPTFPGGSCRGPSLVLNFGYVGSAFSAFLDILFAVYPQYFIVKLNMPLHKKITCGLALGAGSLACAVAIVKISYFNAVGKDFINVTRNDPVVVLWTMVESDILIIMGSMPAIGPFVRTAKQETVKHYRLTKRNAAQTGNTNPLQNLHNSPMKAPRFPDERRFQPLKSQSDVILLSELDQSRLRDGHSKDNKTVDSELDSRG